jgi:phosphoribosylamine--glycine ligase
MKDFPYMRCAKSDIENIPIYGIPNFEDVHICSARYGDIPKLEGNKLITVPGIVTTGYDPLVITGVGKTISEARRHCYGTIKKIRIPNSPFYRTDIGSGRMKKQLPELHRMGYAKGLEF